MIPVWAVPEIFRNTVKGIKGISIFLFISEFHYFPFYLPVQIVLPSGRIATTTTSVSRLKIYM